MRVEINDALLSMMEKDYGMLDEFPEYYAGGTSVDARRKAKKNKKNAKNFASIKKSCNFALGLNEKKTIVDALLLFKFSHLNENRN